MLRFILVVCTCLMAFVVPSQVSADIGISKVKIGGGIGILDVDQIGDTIGPSVNVGVPVHRFDNESLLVMAESSLGIFNFDPTVGTIGVSALMLYKPSAWYFFGGMGLVRLWVSAGLFGQVSSTQLEINIGAGIDISESLLAEARWNLEGADLVVTVGFKIQ